VKRRFCVVSFACAAVLGCSGGAAPAKPSSATLPEGQVARAGAELVSATTIARIVQRQSVAPAAAATAAVSDALFAQSARENLAAGTARSIERAALARAMLQQLSSDARHAGPPTDAELADVLRERWADLDRPEAARTSHAVVLNDKPEREAAAKALAQGLADALQGVANGDELVKKAQAFPGESFQIKAEKLPFITADGRSFQHREAGFAATPALFDVDFARAANALEHPGQLSAVAKSSFGYHVILLEERAPKQLVPREQLPALLAPEVETRRTARTRRELLERLHQAAPVQLDRAFDELTANVKVAP
jgi:parvulin-like peptidyl-prolyl isomerase